MHHPVINGHALAAVGDELNTITQYVWTLRVHREERLQRHVRGGPHGAREARRASLGAVHVAGG